MAARSKAEVTAQSQSPWRAWLTPSRVAMTARLLGAVGLPFLAISYLFAIGAEPEGRPAVDFMSFWSAASLAWRDPPLSYDAASQIAFQARAFQMDGRYLPFLYPPPFLALIAPLGLLPFAVAYPLWAVATYLVYLAGARKLAPGALWPLAVFPALYLNAVQGQTAALFTGLFLLAALQVQCRPWLSGVLFGALIFKPQLALLIPVALIAAGAWRTLAAAGLCAAGLLLAALALLGPESFIAFFHSNSVSLSLLQAQSPLGWAKLPSLFGALRQIGAPPMLALSAQALLALATAIFVGLVWRARRDAPTRAAALAMGALLATPYLLDYDFVLLVAPVYWFARDAWRRGPRTWEIVFLALVSLAPLACRRLSMETGVDPMPALMIAFAALLARRMLRVPSA